MAQDVEALLDGVRRRPFRSPIVSAIGLSASKYRACIARQDMAGIPKGLSRPLLLGIYTRRSG